MEFYECNRCKGRGMYSAKHYKKGSLMVCELCHGSGKLDWLEIIFGKEETRKKIDFINTPIPMLTDFEEFLKIVSFSGIPSRYLVSSYGTKIKDILFKEREN